MAVVRRIQSREGQEEYRFHCPGCGCSHWFRAKGDRPCWEFNGDVDKPTLSPSLKVCGRDENGDTVCHSFVREGMIEFLSDCTHALAGQTVPLEDT